MKHYGWLMCGVVAMFGTVVFGADDEVKVNPRYAGLSKDAVELMPELEPNHDDVIDMYAQLHKAYKYLARLKTTFGVRARRDAEREASRLERNISRAHDEFTEELADQAEPYQERRVELNEKLRDIEADIDISDMENFQEHQQQTSKLRAEITRLENIINTLGELQSVVNLQREDMPDASQLLRLDRTGGEIVKGKEFEDAIDLYYEFKDYQADLARLTQSKEKGDWDNRSESMYDQLKYRLEKSREEYVLELTEIRESLLDDQVDIYDDVEKIEGRMEGTSGRRRERYQEKLTPLTDQLQSIDERLAVLDKLEQLAAPK